MKTPFITNIKDTQGRDWRVCGMASGDYSQDESYEGGGIYGWKVYDLTFVSVSWNGTEMFQVKILKETPYFFDREARHEIKRAAFEEWIEAHSESRKMDLDLAFI